MKKLIVAAGLALAASFAMPAPAQACPGTAKEEQAKEGKKSGKQTAGKNHKKERTSKI